MCTNEEWHDCDFKGTIRVYDNEPHGAKEPVELMDDYDERLRGESQWKYERM